MSAFFMPESPPEAQLKGAGEAQKSSGDQTGGLETPGTLTWPAPPLSSCCKLCQRPPHLGWDLIFQDRGPLYGPLCQAKQ